MFNYLFFISLNSVPFFLRRFFFPMCFTEGMQSTKNDYTLD